MSYDFDSMITRIFDEDFAAVRTGRRNSGDVESWNVSFERVRVVNGHRFRFDLNADLSQKMFINVVTGHCKYEIVFDFSLLTSLILHNNVIAEFFPPITATLRSK